MKRLKISFILTFVLIPSFLFAQRGEERKALFALSTNAVDLAYLGTLNIEGQYAVASRWSLDGQTRYNGWSYKADSPSQFQSRQRSFALGARWWPWYVYSGWWIGSAAQYQEYNRGGLQSPLTEEGDAIGMSLRAGYSMQINPWLNIEFGLSAWGGKTWYKVFACPTCGRKLDEGNKLFFLPNEAIISAMFIF